MDEVVVTATKAETPQKEVTRSVSVISGEDLSVKQGAFVFEPLRQLPGVLVRQSGTIGRTSSLVIRGSNNRQVHVTVDGAHVASPTTGFLDFSNFASVNLERIEVLRGQGSVLYGSDAMGGVVNFVTRRGEGPWSFSLNQEYGTGLNTFQERGEFQGAEGDWHFSGGFSRVDSDGISENDAYEGMNLSTRVGVDLGENTTVDFFFRHIFGLVGIDDGPFRPDPNRTFRTRNSIGSIKLESQVEDWWSTLVRFSTSVENLVSNDPSNSSTNADSLFKLDSERYGVEWMNRFTPFEWETFTIGFEFEDREADNRSFDKTQTTRAVYLQNELHPIEGLTWVMGGRFFRESSFGSEETLETSVAYFIEPLNLKIRGGAGEAFRSPTLNELFFTNFGNPDLVPEKSQTFEVGWDQALWDDKVSWSTTFFRTNYEDLITFTSTPAGFLPINIGKARVDGIELETTFKPIPEVTLKGSYTHLGANVRPVDEELNRLPKNTVSFGIGYSPSRKWGAELEGLMVSSQEETRVGGRQKNEGYLKLDLLVYYRFHQDWRAYIRTENLTNRNYAEVLGFPAAGTVVNFGFTWER